MKILYPITIVIIYILFMLMHKTEKKQNIILWFVISIIGILCYNTLICVICTFVGQLCTLTNLFMCNLVAIIALSIITIRNKKIQKYYVKISDIIVSILILILVICIAYKQYGFPFKLKYEVTDGSTHYFFAQQFYEKTTLLYNTYTSDVFGLYNSNFRLPGAYVNEGILFMIFDEIIATTDIYVIFDLFMLYLSGVLFYFLLKNYVSDNKRNCILTAVGAIMYMLGYQLNSMLYGFVYLSLALNIIIAFLTLISNYQKEEISDEIAAPILSLLSFGMFFSYAFFIPIIYISIIITITIKSKRNKEKILSEQNLFMYAYIIILPLIFGATYFIIMPLMKGLKTEISTIGVDGTIYKNYITNFLYFIPVYILWIAVLIKDKKKENNICQNLFIMSILFTLILLAGYKLKIVSEYYYLKAYYIVWPLAIINIYQALKDIILCKHAKIKIFTSVYVSIYVIAIILSTLILKTNIAINDIFYQNNGILENNWCALENEEIKMAKMVKYPEQNLETYVLASKYQGRMTWMSVLYHNQQIYIDFSTSYIRTIKKWLTERDEQYYLAYHKDYQELTGEEDYLDENNSRYTIIFNNDYGFILKRK